jgi:hypothetical protein
MKAHGKSGGVAGLVAGLVALASCGEDPVDPQPNTDGATVIGDGEEPFEDDPVQDDEQDPATGDEDDPPEVPAYAGPALLSGTGLYSDIATRELADGVLEYDVRYPVWTDGSEKRRFLQLPAGSVIDTSEMNDWVFPVGTKAWQEISAGGLLLNTRFAEKITDEGKDGWQRVAYIWNDAESDADAAPAGQSDIRGTKHDVVSSADCELCHIGSRDGLNGVAAIQLSAEGSDGSLTQLAELGLLSEPPDAEFEVPGTGVVKEALGYLHANCGHCHGERHFLATSRIMRLQLRVEDQTPEETPTYRTTFGIATYHGLDGTEVVVSPGAPEESQLFARMASTDPFVRMPFLATEFVDDDAVELIREWIEGLPPLTP